MTCEKHTCVVCQQVRLCFIQNVKRVGGGDSHISFPIFRQTKVKENKDYIVEDYLKKNLRNKLAIPFLHLFKPCQHKHINKR